MAGDGKTRRDAGQRVDVEPVGGLAIYEGITGWYVASADEHGMELFNIVERDGTMLIRFHETWRGGS